MTKVSNRLLKFFLNTIEINGEQIVEDKLSDINEQYVYNKVIKTTCKECDCTEDDIKGNNKYKYLKNKFVALRVITHILTNHFNYKDSLISKYLEKSVKQVGIYRREAENLNPKISIEKEILETIKKIENQLSKEINNQK